MTRRSILGKTFCVAFFAATVGGIRAQETQLPAGTSSVENAAALAGKQSSLLNQGEDAMERGQMDQATRLLNTALALEPKNARALYDLGYIEERTQQADLAAAYFQKAIDANPNQYEAHAALGRLEASQAKFDAARQQLEAATRLTPANGNVAATKAAAFRLLAHVEDKLQNPSAASEALLSALNLSAEQPEDMVLTAHLAAEQGDAPDAAMEYRKALAAAPAKSTTAEDAQAGLAQALISQKKFSDAEPILRQALTDHPEDAGLQAQLAMVLAAEGKKDEALTQLTALHQKHPEEPTVTRMLADAETQLGEARQADPLYLQLLAMGNSDASLFTARGENLIQQQRFPEAVAMLEKAVAQEPEYIDAWSDLAFAAAQTKQYALVLQSLNERQKSPQDSAATPAAMFLRATALDHLFRPSEAIPEYQKFIAAAQNNFPKEVAEAKERLAVLIRQQQQHKAHQSKGKDN